MYSLERCSSESSSYSDLHDTLLFVTFIIIIKKPSDYKHTYMYIPRSKV